MRRKGCCLRTRSDLEHREAPSPALQSIRQCLGTVNIARYCIPPSRLYPQSIMYLSSFLVLAQRSLRRVGEVCLSRNAL